MTLTPSHLHQYQKFGASAIIEKPEVGLFLDMGLGKTITTLTAIVELLDCMEVSSVLIVAPKRVAESVWMQEAAKWSHTNSLSFSLISGTAKQRKAALAKRADVYLLGRDNVSWLCEQFGGTYLPFDMWVLDELSSFKNQASQRFKALKRVRGSAQRVVGLTGTPAPNGLIDLWAQMYLVDQGERLGKTVTSYREAYFRPDKKNGSIVYSYRLQSDQAKEAIKNAISDIVISMKAEDYLDMPDKVEILRSVGIGEQAQEDYKTFEETLVLQLLSGIGEGENITVAHAAALTNKLLQYSNGAVYDSEGAWHEVHRAKLEALEEIQEEANGRPLLVATAYRHDAERISQYFKKHKPRIFDGQKDIDDWNDGKVSMLIMHPASGGHGLNIQAGSNYMVWFGLTWSLELYKQLNARLYRQGQKEEKVFLYHLVSQGTIDERVMRRLQEKDLEESELMDSVKADKGVVMLVKEILKKYQK